MSELEFLRRETFVFRTVRAATCGRDPFLVARRPVSRPRAGGNCGEAFVGPPSGQGEASSVQS